MVWPEVTSFPSCFSYGLGMKLGHLGLSHACETDYGSYRVMVHAYSSFKADNCGTWELASFVHKNAACVRKNLQLEIFLAQEKSVQTKLLFYSS